MRVDAGPPLSLSPFRDPARASATRIAPTPRTASSAAPRRTACRERPRLAIAPGDSASAWGDAPAGAAPGGGRWRGRVPRRAGVGRSVARRRTALSRPTPHRRRALRRRRPSGRSRAASDPPPRRPCWSPVRSGRPSEAFLPRGAEEGKVGEDRHAGGEDRDAEEPEGGRRPGSRGPSRRHTARLGGTVTAHGSSGPTGSARIRRASLGARTASYSAACGS